MLPILRLFLMLAIPLSGMSATWPAASGSLVDISNAIASASNHDIVTVPAGTEVWTNTLVITKGITLQGNGRGSTVIKDGIMAYGTWLINWTVPASTTSRLTGFSFTTNTTHYGSGQGPRIRYSGLDDSRRIRIDNNHFDQLQGPCIWMYTSLFVFDHNWVTGAASGIPAFLGEMLNNSWGYTQDSSKWADGVWSDGDDYGTDQFAFFEDNNITNLYSTPLTMIDGSPGPRYVFRYNYVYGGSLEGHGAEAARARSIHTIEAYMNTFVGNDARSGVTYIRGGRGVIWSNDISGWTASATFNLLDNRSVEHFNYPINGANGRNPWDKNNAGNPFVTGTCSSAGALTMTDSGKSWSTDQWRGYTLRKTSGKSVTSITRSGDTATVSCTGHGFANGAVVSIYGAGEYGYNGKHTITVSDANTFTYSLQFLATPATPATGTIIANTNNDFALITRNTATQITFSAAAFNSMVFLAGETYEINKVDQSFDQCGVTGGSDLGGVDYPTIPVGWNDQTVSAWHEWNNTREGGADVDFSTGFTGDGDFAVIVPGLHYKNDTQLAGYTPYTYPHPVVSGESPASLPPGRRKPRVGKKDTVIIPGSPWFPMWASEDLSDFTFNLASR